MLLNGFVRNLSEIKLRKILDLAMHYNAEQTQALVIAWNAWVMHVFCDDVSMRREVGQQIAGCITVEPVSHKFFQGVAEACDVLQENVCA